MSRRNNESDGSDVVLVAASQRGDRSALDALLRRHYDRIGAVCRRITGNPTDAADATQEALLAITKGIGRFDGTSSFSTWAYRVATNASLDELRRRKRRPMPTDDNEINASSVRRPLTSAGSKPFDPGDIDARVDIDRAVATLPPDWRAALVLRDLCGLDYAEIAEVLQIPGGTVRSRIARARSALAPLLAATNADTELPAVRRAQGGNQAPDDGRPKEIHVG